MKSKPPYALLPKYISFRYRLDIVVIVPETFFKIAVFTAKYKLVWDNIIDIFYLLWKPASLFKTLSTKDGNLLWQGDIMPSYEVISVYVFNISWCVHSQICRLIVAKVDRNHLKYLIMHIFRIFWVKNGPIGPHKDEIKIR